MDISESMAQPAGPDEHDAFGGFDRDLSTLFGRRRALVLLGGVSLAGLLAACGGSNGSDDAAASTSASTTAGSTTTSPAVGTTSGASGGPGGQPPTGGPGGGSSSSVNDAEGEIPTETNGPYPADGTNGPNVLTADGIVRSDIRSSFGEYSGTTDGVAVTLEFIVIDNTTGQPVADSPVYAWHCTAAGDYSIYGITDQNYLRGMQLTDSTGKAAFTSVYPGCYAGRWPHVHFEVYDSLANATSGSAAVKISQMALPEDVCATVYADSRYGNSSRNLGQISLDTDNVFSDGWTDEMATVTGDATNGYTATLTARV